MEVDRVEISRTPYQYSGRIYLHLYEREKLDGKDIVVKIDDVEALIIENISPKSIKIEINENYNENYKSRIIKCYCLEIKNVDCERIELPASMFEKINVVQYHDCTFKNLHVGEFIARDAFRASDKRVLFINCTFERSDFTRAFSINQSDLFNKYLYVRTRNCSFGDVKFDEIFAGGDFTSLDFFDKYTMNSFGIETPSDLVRAIYSTEEIETIASYTRKRDKPPASKPSKRRNRRNIKG